jgi:sterol desaturase/sphingolipid hydroxylase (fatty acid hydroxylase superfamily)
VHHGRVRGGWIGALRRHHMKHHHESPRSRWGIGSPLWDHVFETAGGAK